MTSNHTIMFVFGLIVAISIALVCSISSIPMLVYDESEIYSCPEEQFAMSL